MIPNYSLFVVPAFVGKVTSHPVFGFLNLPSRTLRLLWCRVTEVGPQHVRLEICSVGQQDYSQPVDCLAVETVFLSYLLQVWESFRANSGLEARWVAQVGGPGGG